MKPFGQFVVSCGIYLLATCILPMADATEQVRPIIEEHPVKGDTNVASRDNVHIDLHIDRDLCCGPHKRIPHGIPYKYDLGYYGDCYGKDYRYGKYCAPRVCRRDYGYKPCFGGYPYYKPYYTGYKYNKQYYPYSKPSYVW